MNCKFTCRQCGIEQDIRERHLGSYLSKSGISKCKSCHREYCRDYQKNKHVQMNPQNYFQCDDCDYLFNYKFERKDQHCPKCKSKNYDDYIN
jgi:homoserine trans-succinylase